jgi:hypothetical protein
LLLYRTLLLAGRRRSKQERRLGAYERRNSNSNKTVRKEGKSSNKIAIEELFDAIAVALSDNNSVQQTSQDLDTISTLFLPGKSSKLSFIADRLQG